MLALAFWILLIAAFGGIGIATLDMGSPPVRVGHGTLAGVGLVILLIGALGSPGPLVWTSFALMLIGFAAGAVFFGLVWRDSSPPRLLVAGHGMLNGMGVILLGIAALV